MIASINDDTKKSIVEKALNTVRPMIQGDGGDIRFVKLCDNIVYVQLFGACVGCPISSYTLTYGIKEAIQKELPEITQVIAVDNENI
jgi:Fe-S cluster biogenesis protein NfuA